MLCGRSRWTANPAMPPLGAFPDTAAPEMSRYSIPERIACARRFPNANTTTVAGRFTPFLDNGSQHESAVVNL